MSLLPQVAVYATQIGTVPAAVWPLDTNMAGPDGVGIRELSLPCA